MTEVEQESRLSRWSRRKQQSAEQTREEDLAFELKRPIPDEHELVENELVGNESDDGLSETQRAGEAQEPVLSDADMEPIDSLTENSDFSKFMSSGVSDELRNLALRKMFKAPIFNIRDGLDEYDEDYTTFEKLGDIVTCDMRHQMELEAEKKAKEEAEAKAMAESTLKSEQLNADDESEQSRAVATEDEDLDDSDVETDLDESAIEDFTLDKDVAANQAVENITK